MMCLMIVSVDSHTRYSLTVFFLIKSCSLNIVCCRVRMEVLDQVLKAVWAALTAASISSVVALGTLVITSLVACKRRQKC